MTDLSTAQQFILINGAYVVISIVCVIAGLIHTAWPCGKSKGNL